MKTLEEIREEIDTVDQQLVTLINKRLELTGEVKLVKGEDKIGVYDPKREEDIISKLQTLLSPEHHGYLKSLYQLIFEYSRSLQRR